LRRRIAEHPPPGALSGASELSLRQSSLGYRPPFQAIEFYYHRNGRFLFRRDGRCLGDLLVRLGAKITVNHHEKVDGAFLHLKTQPKKIAVKFEIFGQGLAYGGTMRLVEG
jgi:hypothetical protein